MHYADRLQNRINATSPICISLEPRIEHLPEDIEPSPAGILTYNQEIIDTVAVTVAAVMPNLAFYELLGPEGAGIFWLTCQYAKEKGLMVIADAKRSAVGAEATAYGNAYLYTQSPIDALTINPYLGSDSITNFLDIAIANNKGIYVIVKTSNPGSGDIQDLPVGDEVVHEYIAQLTESIGMHHIGEKTNLSCLGAIIDTLYPEELKYLRTIMPHVPFLIPQYSAEQNKTEYTHGFIQNGTGALVTTNQSLLSAHMARNWQISLREAVTDLQQELQNAF
jgi:orotidine-5'-phosphate decarboxylase